MGEKEYGHYVDYPVASGEGTVVVPEGESFRKVLILRPGDSTMPLRNIVANAGTSIDVCILVMPGVSLDMPLSVDLVGEGADVSLEGVYLCGGGERVSITTRIRHRAPHCSSNQLFNGIAAGQSHASFYGRIIVAPDAQKTEAYQASHNLLLSPDAVIEAKPELEIYADDVKCSHGATTGSLNEDEQFYMRSRGVPEAEAKVLQMISFIAPVLAHIPSEEERAKVAEEVESSIRKLL